MIDYEKLKLAYEKLKLAHELCQKIDNHFIEIILGDEDIRVRLYYEQGNMYCDIDTIDECIIKLQSLINPQPKYKIDDRVWHLYGQEPVECIIKNIEYSFNGEIGYTTTDGVTEGVFAEYKLHPTKLDLIKDQCFYWEIQKLEHETKFDCPPRFIKG